MQKKIFSMAFGPVLRQFRQGKNMSQEVLSGLVGVSTPYISMLESGHNFPSLEMIFQIAVALNVRPSEILAAMEERLHWEEMPH